MKADNAEGQFESLEKFPETVTVASTQGAFRQR